MGETERQGARSLDPLYTGGMEAERLPQDFFPTCPFARCGSPHHTGEQQLGDIGGVHILREQRITQVPSLLGCVRLVLMRD